MKYKIGQKIYYRGDMANQPGWFEISEVIENPYFRGYDLKEIGGKGRTLKRIFESGISEVDKGHCGTRFVTEEAYKAYREQQIKAMREAAARFRQRATV